MMCARGLSVKMVDLQGNFKDFIRWEQVEKVFKGTSGLSGVAFACISTTGVQEV